MSLSDWESDLTDLESSDDEYVPTKRGPGRPPRPVKEYTVTNALTPPRATNYSTRHIYDLLVNGDIDLDPQYQRDVVWPETKQVGLIDSLMRNYYVPPVIFAVKRTASGEELRVCIDGKQRLTSLRRFLDGEIAHKDSTTGKKYFAKKLSGVQRQMLPDALLRAFERKQLVCMEYNQIDEEQEREIFQRVQMGMALTVAERMQAISGQWSNLIRDIQSVVIGDEGFGDALDWGTGRGRDFQCLATILYLISEKVIFPGAAQLEKWLSRTDPVPSKLRNDVLETFRIFVHLAREPKFSRCFQKPTRISPMEFIMTGYAIYTLRGRLTFSQLSTAIAKMREDVRAKHTDVRANKRVMTTMQQFLRGVAKNPSVLKVDDDDVPASDAIKSLVAKPAKRKRADAQLDDDADKQPKRVTAVKTSSTNATPKATEASKAKTKTTVAKVAKPAATKELGTRTTVKKVAASASNPKTTAHAAKSSAPASQASTGTKVSVTTAKSAQTASTRASQASSGAATPQQSTPSSGSKTMGPPTVPRRGSQDTMDVDSPARETVDSPAQAFPEQQTPSASRNTPAPAQPSASSSAQTLARATPPPIPRSDTLPGSPPVVVKPDPDGSRVRAGSIFDRLAPIRNAKIGAVASPTTPSSSHSMFAQHQQQYLQQRNSPGAAAQSDETCTALLPRTTSDPSFQTNGARPSAPASPQITVAAVQSLLMKARQSPTTSVHITSRRPSASMPTDAASPIAQSPMVPSTTPAVAAALVLASGSPKLSGSPAADTPLLTSSVADKAQSVPPPPTTAQPTPPTTAQPTPPPLPRSLSPTLPRRPDALPRADHRDPLRATRMSPEQRTGPQ